MNPCRKWGLLQPWGRGAEEGERSAPEHHPPSPSGPAAAGPSRRGGPRGVQPPVPAPTLGPEPLPRAARPLAAPAAGEKLWARVGVRCAVRVRRGRLARSGLVLWCNRLSKTSSGFLYPTNQRAPPHGPAGGPPGTCCTRTRALFAGTSNLTARVWRVGTAVWPPPTSRWDRCREIPPSWP